MGRRSCGAWGVAAPMTILAMVRPPLLGLQYRSHRGERGPQMSADRNCHFGMTSSLRSAQGACGTGCRPEVREAGDAADDVAVANERAALGRAHGEAREARD